MSLGQSLSLGLVLHVKRRRLNGLLGVNVNQSLYEEEFHCRLTREKYNQVRTNIYHPPTQGVGGKYLL